MQKCREKINRDYQPRIQSENRVYRNEFGFQSNRRAVGPILASGMD